MKKIVVLTGSPRKDGNSNRMAESFARAAQANGCEVILFDTNEMVIGGCQACDSCFSGGEACIFEDDFNEIAKQLEEAEGIVFVSPVYWYTFSAQIKAVIDRLYSFCVAEKSFAGKKSVLISCCEEDSLETFDGIKFAYDKTIELLQCENAGYVLVPGVGAEGDIEKTDGLKMAAQLAEKF
ncbi:MAG: flavodoxin family protein [Clostridiales bacterium]|nr:flavodoxin family protein [Clostridiales bacterium]